MTPNLSEGADKLPICSLLIERSWKRHLMCLVCFTLGVKMGLFSKKEIEYLREQELGRIATVSRAQFPHVVPVAFATDGENLFVNMEYGSKKARNTRENPRVSHVVDDAPSWGKFHGVLVGGTAEMISSGKLHQIGRDHIYEKYPKFQETYPIQEGGWSKYILVITPTKVTSWGL
jgi:pyridoxamine 5'-phosphate oxidase family protein